MSISTDIAKDLTETEIDRLVEVETALKNTEHAEQIEQIKTLKTAYSKLKSDPDHLPNEPQELDEIVSDSEKFLILVDCLPELEKLGEADSYVLLGKLVVEYLLMLSKQISDLEYKDIHDWREERFRQHPSLRKATGITLMALNYASKFRDVADNSNGILSRAVREIASHSLPKVDQLDEFPPDSVIYDFGYSLARTSTLTKFTRVGGIYLLIEGEYKSAAETFESARRRESDSYRMRALTGWANLAWLLDSDHEQTRKRFSNSVKRVARNPHPDAKEEAEMIMTLKQKLLGEDSQVERDDFDWQKDRIL